MKKALLTVTMLLTVAGLNSSGLTSIATQPGTKGLPLPSQYPTAYVNPAWSGVQQQQAPLTYGSTYGVQVQPSLTPAQRLQLDAVRGGL